ncbi:MAG: UDP-N-acetylmuramoyl-L-alanyl-D-glutamate--2,6-diaminopimelate ligase [Acidothermus sp.]|nr:UDP-N-acetylmuramoyl-L-alanyl-D-glutamate--2,6-diaminopimelate ligase [Acidothermus sp.]MCL6537794.1 UDP-N-acetylmuramoyl-L-alanyl-D-glutamate--2,6-diaminopimelate ligase [Acidothermus sp.]
MQDTVEAGFPRPSRVVPVPLDRLAAIANAELRGPAVEVTGVTHDSRAVRPGDLFAALPGFHTHGADFARAALDAGALAVLTDREGASRLPSSVPTLICVDPRGVLGPISAEIFGHPSEAMLTLGVTGTNGKTTTVFLLDAGLRAAGYRTALLGTILTRIGDSTLPSVRTTPEAPQIQALLAAGREAGAKAAAMEVSSHALALHRADGTRFACVGFTNLSHDHLDFHGTLEAYFAAKARLFTPFFADQAVIMVDDDHGCRLADDAPIPVQTATTRPDRQADWTVISADHTSDGIQAIVRGPHGDISLRMRLHGRFNLANGVLALAMLANVGIDPAVAAAGIGDLAGVPGRLEPVNVGQPFAVLVDYAHTPEAVSTVANAVRPTQGKLIIVLGCGGDRDPTKRPAMGAAAARLAELTVITSDNPRSEDPKMIAEAMMAGVAEVAVEERGEVVVELDRTAAIQFAIDHAGPGDVVLLAGKGHETGQEIAGVTFPFDDREVARRALAVRGWTA